MCVVVADPKGLKIGTELYVLYHHDLMQGEVRHIRQRDDGMYLVGLQCQS